jgi:hypothetical protein
MLSDEAILIEEANNITIDGHARASVFGSDHGYRISIEVVHISCRNDLLKQLQPMRLQASIA